MGPSLPLLNLGATVAAVARPGSKLEALMEQAKTTSGRLLVPAVQAEGAASGTQHLILVDDNLSFL